MKKYVFYVNIGNLPQHVAEKYLEIWRERCEEFFDEDESVMICPIEEGDGVTRLERVL